MAGGLLPGDDDFDPGRIDKELERLRGNRPGASDDELLWWAQYQCAYENIQDLQAELLHPNTSDERVREISGKLPALRKQLSDLEAAGPPQGSPPRDD
jgi:hypothetical protein